MGMLHQLDHWSTAHHPKWLVLLRVALGLGLFLKGITFISNSAHLEMILAESSLNDQTAWLTLVITWAHLLGGFLIIIGLLTRWAALLQIPILMGAVIFVNTPNEAFTSNSELFFSFVVFLLLIFFFFEGGGPISLDNYFKKHPV